MIDILLVYDDKDPELGKYFKNCAEALLLAFQESNRFCVKTIDSSKLNSASIDFAVEQFSEPFILISFSHGNSSALIKNGIPYLDKNNKIEKFTNAFLYTIACSSGKDLGGYLGSIGCIFWGYSETTFVFPNFESIFQHCDLYGFISFLNGNEIRSSFSRSKENYNTTIDRLLDDNALAASYLRANRDAMVQYNGNDKVLGDFCKESRLVNS